jgi:hypothetical protein
MAALQEGAVLRLFIDGRAIMTVHNITQKTNAGQLPLKVLNGGLIGFVKGAGDNTITIAMYVFAGGFEEPIQEWATKGSVHTVQIGCGPTDIVCTGKFTETDLSQSTDQGTEFTCTFVAPPEIFE